MKMEPGHPSLRRIFGNENLLISQCPVPKTNYQLTLAYGGHFIWALEVVDVYNIADYCR
jgi:hypothetical protein